MSENALEIRGLSKAFSSFTLGPLKIGVRDGTVARIGAVAISLIALGCAAFINHRTLTRSTSLSRAYQRPQRPFRVPTTPDIG